MLKSLRWTVALSLAFIPLSVSFSGAAIAEERQVYVDPEGFNVFIDPDTIMFKGEIRDFVQKNVPWEGDTITILEQSVNCETAEFATRNIKKQNLSGTVTRSSGTVKQFYRPKSDSTEAFLMKVICGLEGPTGGVNSAESSARPTASDRSLGLTSTVSSDYSVVTNLADPPICYMQNRVGQMFDLTGLCGFVGTPTTTSFSSGGGFSGGGSSGGSCDVPSDRDSAGRRCGGRAASERTGGR